MIQLYDLPPSGNCYRVRLMLALLALAYERVVLRHVAGRFDNEAVAKLNPLAEVPVLVDGDAVLRDSQAILLYLALRYGPRWTAAEPGPAAAITQWLSFSANEVQNGPRYARAIKKGMIQGDLSHYQRIATRALGVLERRLIGRTWLELERPSIADVACYPYICNAEEGGLDMQSCPAVRTWLTRVEALPGFVAFDPGYPPAA
jgi:glutathione S-transferase